MNEKNIKEKLLTPEESLQKFFKDTTNYMIKIADGDIDKIPTFEDIRKLHYIEQEEYNKIYNDARKIIENK